MSLPDLLITYGDCTNKMIVYFSPACHACYTYEFKDNKNWKDILHRYVKAGKLMLIFHPVLMPGDKDAQTAILQILYTDRDHFLTHLKTVMEYQNLWTDDTEENRRTLMDMVCQEKGLEKETIKDLLEMNNKDPLYCVKLIAYYAGFEPNTILSALNNDALKRKIMDVLKAPKQFSDEGVDRIKNIKNLPAFSYRIDQKAGFHRGPLKPQNIPIVGGVAE